MNWTDTWSDGSQKTTQCVFFLEENGWGDRKYSYQTSGIRAGDVPATSLDSLVTRIIPWVKRTPDCEATPLPPNNPRHPSNWVESSMSPKETDPGMWYMLDDFDFRNGRSVFMAVYSNPTGKWIKGHARYDAGADEFYWVWKGVSNETRDEIEPVPVSLNHYRIAEPWQYLWMDIPGDPEMPE